LDDKKYSLNSTNNTAEEIDSREKEDVNISIWTTERLEKFTDELNESLEEDHIASITPPIVIDEITDIDRDPDFSSVTESSVKYEAIYCQYDGSAINTDTEETRNQEQSINWSRNDNVISGKTTATIDLQEESPQTSISIDIVTTSYADTKDRALLLDEPIDRIDEIKTHISSTPETTISDAVMSVVGDENKTRNNGKILAERTFFSSNRLIINIYIAYGMKKLMLMYKL